MSLLLQRQVSVKGKDNDKDKDKIRLRHEPRVRPGRTCICQEDIARRREKQGIEGDLDLIVG